MRYKGKLKPSYLLCPETYRWFQIENCLSKLDANKYSRLNDDADAIDENRCQQSDIDNIKILYGNQLHLLKNITSADKNEFTVLGNYIGKDALSNIIIYIN